MLNTNQGDATMLKQYHEDANVNFAIKSILTNKQFTFKFLNSDMFVNDRIVNAIMSVFGLSKSNAKIVTNIVVKEFYGEWA